MYDSHGLRILQSTVSQKLTSSFRLETVQEVSERSYHVAWKLLMNNYTWT
jgi:hypothetical protein